MEPQAAKSSSSDFILTDVSNKYNKKITYKINESDVEIESHNIKHWNFLQQLKSLFKDIFLPIDYPESVSSDYLEYQIWDTCQTFCSSISGTLAMRAVLQGIGVGSEAATPASAAITWIMKDGTGMVGSILFAWLKGSHLDADFKKWRLFADISNDIAMFLELYIPFMMTYSKHILCIATVLKAVVGTAGASTRAAVITHHAIKGNIADVSAKDGSQEIFTNLCAFVFGILLLKNVTETKQIWSIMCTATLFHLIFNYNAVKCLRINVFNKQRFCLTLRTYLLTSSVPTIAEVNKKESVFLFKGLSDENVCGFYIVFGHSLKTAIKANNYKVSVLIHFFKNKKYLILPHLEKKKLYIAFRKNFTDQDVLKAYFHAILLAVSITYLQQKKYLSILSKCEQNSPVYQMKDMLKDTTDENEDDNENETNKFILQAYTFCDKFAEKEFIQFCNLCDYEGWNVFKHCIFISNWRIVEESTEKKHIIMNSKMQLKKMQKKKG